MKKSKQKRVVIPRNPLVVQMLNRQGQGRHGKSEKVKRRDEKMVLKKGWDVSSPFCFLGLA
jgi:hypothetical protein